MRRTVARTYNNLSNWCSVVWPLLELSYGVLEHIKQTILAYKPVKILN